MSAVVPLAQYCERSGDGFWAEPVNALTNVAFLVAALLIARRLHGQPGGPGRWWDLWLLALLAAAVGVGSFLWHTLRAPWSQWADIVPILLFINVFLASFMVRVGGAGAVLAVVGLLLFNLINVGLQMLLPRDLLNGSVFYLPTWIALAGMVAYTFRRHRPSARLLLAAVVTFTVSLTLRTLDQSLCAVTDLGTHFGWHLLNGAVLYAVAIALLIHGTGRGRTGPVQGI